MMHKTGHETCREWIAFDPRARIIALFLLVVAVCSILNTKLLAVLLLLSFLFIPPSGMGWKAVAKRLLPVNAFMLLLWLTMPLLGEGPSVRLLDSIDLSLPGIGQALAITLKANAIVVFTSALLYPVETGALAAGMHRLGAPTKLVWLFILSHRYVLGLADKVAKSAMAIRMRSGKGGKMRFTAYGGLFAKLFVGGHESGERLYIAMRSRGYTDRFALRRQMRWRWRDTFFTVCIALVACGAVWIGRCA